MLGSVGRRTLVVVLLVGASSVVSFNDYWKIFCGKENCYELLSLPEDATLAAIKRAYRSESLVWHPDKNPSPEANARFQQISKAYQVLSDEEQRKKYDQYRVDPSGYWAEYGNYYFTSYAPKSDVRMVLVLLVFIISVFVPIVQYQQYQQVCAFLKRAAIKGLGLHEGGTKETIEIRRRALELRDQYREERKTNGDAADKKAAKKKVKDEEDPDFLRAVDEVVSSMEIKGSYRKPSWNDVLAYRLVLLPYSLGKWTWFNANWYYVHSVKGLPLTGEEQEYLAIRTVGQTAWEGITAQERAELLQARVWEGDNFERYKEVKIAEELKKRPGLHKKMLRHRRKAQAEEDEDGM